MIEEVYCKDEADTRLKQETSLIYRASDLFLSLTFRPEVSALNPLSLPSMISTLE